MMHLMFAGRFACVSVDALRARRRAARELKERDVVEADLLGPERLASTRGCPRWRRPARAPDKLACTVPSRRLILAVVTSARAPHLATMWRVLSRYAWSCPSAERRVDRHRDDPGADRAEEAEDEVVVGREDERDAVALAQAERLERAAVPRAHPLDGREGEGRLARITAFGPRVAGTARRSGGSGEAGHARLGDESKAARRFGLGGVFDGLDDRAGRHALGAWSGSRRGREEGVGEESRKTGEESRKTGEESRKTGEESRKKGVRAPFYQSRGAGPTPKPGQRAQGAAARRPSGAAPRETQL